VYRIGDIILCNNEAKNTVSVQKNKTKCIGYFVTSPTLKELGIIGTGKNAATWYFQKCQELYQHRYGKDAVCPVKLINIRFEPINRILPDQMEEAGRLLVPYLYEVDDSNVSRFILANITLHEAIDLQKNNLALKTPFVSLRTVIKNHWNQKIKKAMILGTYYTMQSEYIPSLFDDFDVAFIHPNDTDFRAIDQLRTEYYTAPNPDESKKVFDQLKNNYPKVDCFIIACTEHALALADYNDSLENFNLPKLQCVDLIKNNSD
jgi:aspartate/glutamate racemase